MAALAEALVLPGSLPIVHGVHAGHHMRRRLTATSLPDSERRLWTHVLCKHVLGACAARQVAHACAYPGHMPRGCGVRWSRHEHVPCPPPGLRARVCSCDSCVHRRELYRTLCVYLGDLGGELVAVTRPRSVLDGVVYICAK